MIALLLDHLWQSSIFAGGAGFLTLVLSRNSAGARFWLWFAASAKFLVPFAILASLATYALTPITPPLSVAPLMAMAPVVQPFSGPKPVLSMTNLTTPAAIPAAPIAPATTHLDPSLVLLALWAIGFLAIFGRWIARWRQLRLLLRAAAPSPFVAPIAVKFAGGRLEPGLVGIFRPVIILPKGIEQQLSPPELNAILAHELCHWRRRDNLLAAFHMLVEALFWFFPLVWWLGARLNAERERACDESVLAAGNDPKTYAEGILKVCRLYLQSPLACAAGVSGAGLKARMEIIMENRVIPRLSRAKKLFLGASAMATLAVPIAFGLLTAPPALAQATPQAIQTPEETAELRSEQSAPRKAISVDPKHFDKFVGYYQLGPSSVATVHRDGTHFLIKLTGQTDVEVFPESETKFFTTSIPVPAQWSFTTDSQGRVTESVLHQGGFERHMPRIDEAAAKKLEAAIWRRASRPARPAPAPRLRSAHHLESRRKRAGGFEPIGSGFGRRREVAVTGGTCRTSSRWGRSNPLPSNPSVPNGMDVYDVAFRQWRDGMECYAALTPDGKVGGMGGRRLP